ncbi:RNA polymerase sigma factor [Nocardioides sp.]|uniref:RNA polymerase sigma factor n=1 Tax=Nocardioides sp. TaxID=35761 RepID=UPI003519BB6B
MSSPHDPPASGAPAAPAAGAPGAGDAAEHLAREAYRLHGGELYGYAMVRLRDDGASQDAVQETVVRAWRAAHRFDPARGSLRSWLFAIHRNTVIDQLDARGWRVVLREGDDDVPPERAMGHDHAEQLATEDAVVRAVGALSPDHRTAIVETYLRDRPYAEVASDLAIPVATVRTRVFHALRHLRRHLGSTDDTTHDTTHDTSNNTSTNTGSTGTRAEEAR